ncbi:MAG TPA: DUF1289 domain-containing protein [Alphaproteobacteria bacterium]|nr:DUF1289 domain-containing protein [Alphaproteobacteria bacterium]
MTASPCISICRLDPATQICTGCGRTIAEIAAWPNLSEAERAAIVRRIEATKAPAQAPQG